MITKKIGGRGIMFTYEEDESPLGGGISIYMINTADKIFLCDTHLGPKSMEYIYDYIDGNLYDKEMYIFNSHADWDHIWGNCYFQEPTIIAHESCRRRMAESGEYDLADQKEYCNGEVEIVLPNLIFTNSIRYVDEDIEFTYAPGHTVDSAICYDRKDEILYVGDLLEAPLPFIYYHDLNNYLNSLQYINSQSAKYIITAHSGLADDKLINNNIKYIKDLIEGKTINIDKGLMGIHKTNLKGMMLSSYESSLRGKYGKEFDYNKCYQQIKSYQDMSYDKLKVVLSRR